MTMERGRLRVGDDYRVSRTILSALISESEVIDRW
jgi:hypothetical protein